jgi:hypothetical protein
LKLDNLHLDATRRTSLLAELAALNAGEQRAMDAMRHSNAEQLATYRAQLERDATAAAGEQDRHLRTKSGANYLILQRVFNEARNGFGELPSPAQTAAFARSYAASGSARTIASAMQSSADDLSQRYRQLATRDAQSQREVDAQLRTLETDREALYRSIVAQVRAAALTYARQRGLGRVVFANAPPKAGQLDLTASIAARLGQGI